MNLNKLKTQILISVIVLSFIILGILIYQLVTATPRELPLAEVEIIDGFERDIEGLTLDPGRVNLSTTFSLNVHGKTDIPILIYEPVDINLAIEQFTSELELNSVEEIEVFAGESVMNYFNSAGDTLTAYPSHNLLIYTKPFPDEVNFRNEVMPSMEEIQAEATRKLQQLGLYSNNLELKSTAYLEYPSVHREPVFSANAANAVELTYTYRINGISIIDSPTYLYPNEIQIRLDKDLNMVKFHSNVVGQIGQETALTTINGTNAIREKVQQDGLKLLTTNHPAGKNYSVTGVSSGELMYYAHGDRLIPVFILDSTVVAEDGTQEVGKGIVRAFD